MQGSEWGRHPRKLQACEQAPSPACGATLRNMDQLIRGATVVTLDPARRILPGADVLVRDGRIAAVGGDAAAQAAPGALVIRASGKALIPGLVQAHVHLCQTLFRNLADGYELLDWLRLRIWPLEAAHDERSMAASARLGIAELVRGGTTAILDMGTARHTDAIFDVARDAGFRLTCGKAHMDHGADLPAGLRESTDASLREAEALCRRWHGAEGGRLRYAFAPRFVLSCSDALLREVGGLARSLGARLHTHASENRGEGAAVRERFGGENIEVLHRFGLTGADTALAHCVWPSESEVELLHATGSHVVHCPSSNLKLASGIAPVPEMIARGVHVALGADGAPCNNDLDGFLEMRLAALLHKPRCGPRTMPAAQVLELATLGGARALGLEAEIGSIEVGKRADLALVDLTRVHTTPAGDDVCATIVHAAQRSDVTDVWIEGRRVLRDRELVTLDEAAIVAEARVESARLAAGAL